MTQCNAAEHRFSRRQMLGGLTGAAAAMRLGALGGIVHPAVGEELRKRERQVLLLWLDGGMSQLESWDPKPSTQFGGPFRAISTAIPGIQISELMPRIACRLDQLAVVRSMKTQDNSHSSGVPRVLRGDPTDRGVVYPYLGSAIARLLGETSSGLPPYVWVKPGNGGFISKHAGFLGPKYGALALGDGKPPTNLVRPATLSQQDAESRRQLRQQFNRRYVQRRDKAFNEANSYVFDVADTLMQHAELFDQSSLAAKDRERYGENDLGRHLLLSLRLLEAGVRFIQVSSYGWDTHGDNFNSHANRVPKVDQAFSALLQDLEDRGMLDHVLVVMMCEFGRTPRINGSQGRDHWPNAWSLAMTGVGIQRGAVLGKTRADGTDVLSDPYDIGHMFHTWYSALGLESEHTEYVNDGQPLPVAHDDYGPVPELLDSSS